MNETLLRQAAREARGLAIDAVAAAESGHLGLPLGAAEMGAVLFGHFLNFNPERPRWLNRDRFVLSAGHGSMFLYAWLHLSGYDLPLEEIRNFRQMGSLTPGHPEFGETPGVECTTGPLGQGVGNAAGMAMSGKMAAAVFNTPEHAIFGHHVICLAGDGDLQEGVSAEASALAAHLGLDNLIILYDSNDVTLDAAAGETQSEDTARRYQAYGFDTGVVDGHDMGAVLGALEKARAGGNGRPKLIIAKTVIGKGIPEVAGTAKAHGEAGAMHGEAARRVLGLPAGRFHVSAEVREYFGRRKRELLERHSRWERTYAAWRKACPDKAEILEAAAMGKRPAAEELLAKTPEFKTGARLATRAAGGEVLQSIAGALPLLVSGSADLHGSTKNYIKGGGDFSKSCHTGRNIRYGIREHAMGAILNGFAYDGIFPASGATFLVFSDYMRPAVRLAALAKLPLFYIWTHDSVGVGEDGPTHQPVETVSALRCIPNLDIIRPADPEETAGAFAAAAARADGPTGLILTRQSVPMLDGIPVQDRRRGVLKGGYIARRETAELDLILLSCGSELQHALAAAERLGPGARVVSMPCFERFERQPQSYRDEVLPPSCRKRIAIEAGVPQTWHCHTGLDGAVIGLESFGRSAPGAEVMEAGGITAEAVLDAARRLR